ncbi:MAG TPA: ATP synthase F1 subunit epsilon [Egibacteraceae bacterium]|nr:ATP synthase F1 subunit epsilon [Egibacteraceae bacterium]
MEVHVVSAERELFAGEATEVYARSLDGEIGILPGHQPALLALAVAPVRVKQDDGSEVVFAVHGGFLEFRENHLTVLTDVAEPVGEIDRDRAEAAKQRAEQRLAADSEDANAKLQRARADLRLSVGEGT